jgi:hypothetical protein
MGRGTPSLPRGSTPSAEFHTRYRPGEEKHEKMAQFGKGNNHQHELSKENMEEQNCMIIKVLVVGEITGYKGSQGLS